MFDVLDLRNISETQSVQIQHNKCHTVLWFLFTTYKSFACFYIFVERARGAKRVFILITFFPCLCSQYGDRWVGSDPCGELWRIQRTIYSLFPYQGRLGLVIENMMPLLISNMIGRQWGGLGMALSFKFSWNTRPTPRAWLKRDIWVVTERGTFGRAHTPKMEVFSSQNLMLPTERACSN